MIYDSGRLNYYNIVKKSGILETSYRRKKDESIAGYDNYRLL